ncbi:MAG: MFS transporter [Planctomycetota bacterium]|nr:MFS transporter [Planctomycetota bacterium]
MTRTTAPLPNRLSEAETARSMHLSIIEGVAYAIMVAFGEACFLADAVRLGASPLQQGLVISLPLCGGALGSVVAVAWLRGVTSRRRIVAFGSFVQVLVLAALALTHAAGAGSTLMLIALAVMHQAGGQMAGTAWNSWYGDVVPSGVRGSYFGVRSRYVYLATLLGVVGSGVMLHFIEPGAAGVVAAGAGGAGFAWVFGIAAFARLVCVVLFGFSPEPRFRGLPAPRTTRRFLGTSRGRVAWRVLLAGGAMQFLVYIGSPYFGPYMLRDLQFTYVEYMLASLAVVVLKVVALPAWGRLVDAHGARSVYALALLLVALVPLPWLWAQGLGWVLVAQALSGFAWGGYEVSFFSTLLEATYKPTRPYVFAAQNLIQGTGQLLGSLAGAGVIAWAGGSFLACFAVSAVGRGVLALIAPLWIPRPAARDSRGRLLLRVIGFRAHGGLSHRPVDEEGA